MLAALRFGACFAALLGTPDHGRWLVAPQEEARITRRYRPGHAYPRNAISKPTTARRRWSISCRSGGEHSEIVRLVIGTQGKVKMHTELILRFGYGAIVPWVTRLEDGALRAIAGPDMAVLRTPVHLRGKDMTTVGEFTVARGETIPFILTYSRSHKPLPTTIDPTAVAGGDREILDGMVGKMPAGRRVVRRGAPLDDHAQSADL